jgi:hypothetical protein
MPALGEFLDGSPSEINSPLRRDNQDRQILFFERTRCQLQKLIQIVGATVGRLLASKFQCSLQQRSANRNFANDFSSAIHSTCHNLSMIFSLNIYRARTATGWQFLKKE